MARMPALSSLYSVLFLFLFLLPGALSATFTLRNSCGYTVWPGVLPNAGTVALETTGFSLDQGESKTLQAPHNWSGRIWGRTLCSTDSSTGRFTCGTGDCRSGKVECSDDDTASPATLVEFTLDSRGGTDLYAVSLVHGYNLPVLVVPQGRNGSGAYCSATGCLEDLNGSCPSDLKVTTDGGHRNEAVACKSACEAFGSPQYCCSGAYGNPNTCKPSSYSHFFKNACPRAYSYPYDNASFTCANSNYTITFCPRVTSQKSSGQSPKAAGPTSINPTMGFHSGHEVNHASLSLPRWAYLAPGVLVVLLVLYFSRRPGTDCMGSLATMGSLLSVVVKICRRYRNTIMTSANADEYPETTSEYDNDSGIHLRGTVDESLGATSPIIDFGSAPPSTVVPRSTPGDAVTVGTSASKPR